MSLSIQAVEKSENLSQGKPVISRLVIPTMTDKSEVLIVTQGKERSPVPTLTNVGTSGLESNRNVSRSIV